VCREEGGTKFEDETTTSRGGRGGEVVVGDKECEASDAALFAARLDVVSGHARLREGGPET
jgi:hypothetical protein